MWMTFFVLDTFIISACDGCMCCSSSLVPIIISGPSYVGGSDVINTDGPCATRNVTCLRLLKNHAKTFIVASYIFYPKLDNQEYD